MRRESTPELPDTPGTFSQHVRTPPEAAAASSLRSSARSACTHVEPSAEVACGPQQQRMPIGEALPPPLLVSGTGEPALALVAGWDGGSGSRTRPLEAALDSAGIRIV